MTSTCAQDPPVGSAHCSHPGARGGDVCGAQGKDFPSVAGLYLVNGLPGGALTLPRGGMGRGTPGCRAGSGGEGPTAVGAAFG